MRGNWFNVFSQCVEVLSLVSMKKKKKSQRLLRSCLSISSELLWYYWLEESLDPLKFSFQTLARSQELMQTYYTLALHFSLPLNALVTKGHPNPMTDLSIAVLTEHFAVSHSKFQKAFWKLCACICVRVATLPLRPFIDLPGKS